jgi:glycosyltransferase involved in cell wall biosynthesis
MAGDQRAAVGSSAAIGAPGTKRSGAQRVCVAVPTFRRPVQLAALLRELASQAVDADRYDVQFLVIDNDATPTARSVVEGGRSLFRHPVGFVHVPEPGLSVVRNAALGYAARSADFLAMIDDDEVPGPTWLAELLRVQAITGADAVIGPVPAHLPAGAPSWIRKGGFFETVHASDCAILDDGYSGNCLLAMPFVNALNLEFENAFNFSGGEDQLFFRTLIANGGRIVFAARAVATETIPPGRASLRYLVAREFRKGNTLTFCDLELMAAWHAKTTRIGKGAGLMTLSACRLIPRTLLHGGAGAAKSVCEAARAAGMFAGLAGYRFSAYSRARLDRSS